MIGLSYGNFASSGGGGFTPADLNPVLWLDAGVGVTETAGATSAWANQGSGSRDATQGTALNQPTYNATGFGTNNLPYLDFDGTNSFLTCGTEYSKLANYTIFTVFEADVVANKLLYGDADNSVNFRSAGAVCYLTGGKFNHFFGDGTNYTTSTTSSSYSANTPYILQATHVDGEALTSLNLNGDDLEVNVGGNGATSSVAGTKYNFSIGQGGQYGGLRFNGKIAEILIFNSVLSTDNITNMETYLNDKYATY